MTKNFAHKIAKNYEYGKIGKPAHPSALSSRDIEREIHECTAILDRHFFETPDADYPYHIQYRLRDLRSEEIRRSSLQTYHYVCFALMAVYAVTLGGFIAFMLH